MDNIKLYEIDAKYINYLSAFAEHLFHNKQAGQSNERKYIGVILTVNGMEYFAPKIQVTPPCRVQSHQSHAGENQKERPARIQT
jgi:protein AbiQ